MWSPVSEKLANCRIQPCIGRAILASDIEHFRDVTCGQDGPSVIPSTHDLRDVGRAVTRRYHPFDMTQPEERLRAAVAKASPRLAAITDAEAGTPPAPGKWSPKQIIGHLVDSASNNHQRFVRANFTDDLIFPGYDQERWVSVGRYAEAPWESLVMLWREFNLQIARVMEATPSDVKVALRARHNLHQLAWHPIAEDQPATLEYFMRDYVEHLEHHLVQVFEASTQRKGISSISATI
jgi:DinB superfamily